MKTLSAIILLAFLSGIAAAQTVSPQIAITKLVEDGKPMLQATVTSPAKPMENVIVQFFAKRTFGNLLLGEDTTLDDGTAAVAWPADLPGGPDGQVHVIVKIKTPAQFSGVHGESMFAGAPPMVVDAPIDRALWAPHAPLALMVVIFGLLGAVWLCYAKVVLFILEIRRGAVK